MSFSDSIHKKEAATAESGDAGNAQPSKSPDSARKIPNDIAHDLNNVLMIIQGYADRLLRKHGEDLTLTSHLKIISEAAKRAATIIRDATPSGGSGLPPRQNL